MNNETTCKDCLFKQTTRVGGFECRRYPPTMQLVPHQKTAIGLQGMENKVDLQIRGFYVPVADSTPACGEFNSKETMQ